MKRIYVFSVALLGIVLVTACGKVSNETGVTKPAEEKIYYTTLVGQVPVAAKRDPEQFTLTPSDNVFVVSFSLVNKDGSETVLAWGKGAREKPASPDVQEESVSPWVAKSYNSENKAITRETPEDILVKWVPGKRNVPERWEYYIQYESCDKAVYLVNVMNSDGSLVATIPIDGKAVSENTTAELPRPSRKTTLWSRIFLADEGKNIVKKSGLTVAEISERYDDAIYATLRYRPADLRVKKFSAERPQWLAPTEQSLEYYLSEALVQVGQGSRSYHAFLESLPVEVIPTATVGYLRGFGVAKPPVAAKPSPVLPQYRQKPFPVFNRPPVNPAQK